MTKQEFEIWKRHTEGSRLHWQVDEIQLHNHQRYLIYKGGQDGKYVEVDADGKATIGTYEGALPCITDACFMVKHTKQFASQNEAMTKLIECMGTAFLLDLTGSRAYPSALTEVAA